MTRRGDYHKNVEFEYWKKIEKPHLILRLDGKCFSSFTRSLEKPYDKRLMQIFKEVLLYLGKKYNVKWGYSQSDEISLYWDISNSTREHIFGGKTYKINSVVASSCTVYFNEIVKSVLPSLISKDDPPLFDCRCFGYDTEEDVLDYFKWRQKDCFKNATTLIASKYFSHKELLGKSTKERIAMIPESLDDCNTDFLYGLYLQKSRELRGLSYQEIEDLPEKHHARQNPNLIRECASFYLIERRF